MREQTEIGQAIVPEGVVARLRLVIEERLQADVGRRGQRFDAGHIEVLPGEPASSSA